MTTMRSTTSVSHWAPAAPDRPQGQAPGPLGIRPPTPGRSRALPLPRGTATLRPRLPAFLGLLTPWHPSVSMPQARPPGLPLHLLPPTRRRPLYAQRRRPTPSARPQSPDRARRPQSLQKTHQRRAHLQSVDLQFGLGHRPPSPRLPLARPAGCHGAARPHPCVGQYHRGNRHRLAPRLGLTLTASWPEGRCCSPRPSAQQPHARSPTTRHLAGSCLVPSRHPRSHRASWTTRKSYTLNDLLKRLLRLRWIGREWLVGVGPKTEGAPVSLPRYMRRRDPGRRLGHDLQVGAV